MRIDDVAGHHQRARFAERIDEGRGRVGDQQHVAFIDRGPAADAGSVDAEAFFKRVFVQLADRIGNVLLQTGQIGEAQIHLLDLFASSQIPKLPADSSFLRGWICDAPNACASIPQCRVVRRLTNGRPQSNHRSRFHGRRFGDDGGFGDFGDDGGGDDGGDDGFDDQDQDDQGDDDQGDGQDDDQDDQGDDDDQDQDGDAGGAGDGGDGGRWRRCGGDGGDNGDLDDMFASEDDLPPVDDDVFATADDFPNASDADFAEDTGDWSADDYEQSAENLFGDHPFFGDTLVQQRIDEGFQPYQDAGFSDAFDQLAPGTSETVQLFERDGRLVAFGLVSQAVARDADGAIHRHRLEQHRCRGSA